MPASESYERVYIYVPRQGFVLLCQLVVSPGILPDRLISASFPPLGATLSFRVYTSTELVHC